MRLRAPLALAVPGAVALALEEAEALREVNNEARWLLVPAPVAAPLVLCVAVWGAVAGAVDEGEGDGDREGEALAQPDALARAQGVGVGETAPEGLPLRLDVLDPDT